MFSENIFWNQGLILINILGLISTLLLIFKVKNVLYCLSIFYWSILIYLIYFWILRNWNIILKQAEKLKREMEWFAKVPWLPWITLRPFRCLCYHQRQLLLFLIHSHGGKSSIFYVSFRKKHLSLKLLSTGPRNILLRFI